MFRLTFLTKEGHQEEIIQIVRILILQHNWKCTASSTKPAGRQKIYIHHNDLFKKCQLDAELRVHAVQLCLGLHNSRTLQGFQPCGFYIFMVHIHKQLLWRSRPSDKMRR